MQARRASEGIRVPARHAHRIPLLALRAWMKSGLADLVTVAFFVTRR